jgi:hypothetical protein
MQRFCARPLASLPKRICLIAQRIDIDGGWIR